MLVTRSITLKRFSLVTKTSDSAVGLAPSAVAENQAGLKVQARLCHALLLHPARKVQAVNLADHGIAGDAIAKPAGDLAGAQPFRPELLQKLDALICPGQFRPSKIDFMLCSQTESLTPRRTCSVPACSFTKLTVRRYIS